jgi:hypothetical protein
MTLFLIHDGEGRINQANKVFVPDKELKAYKTMLGDLGQTYVTVKRAQRLPSPDHWWVSSGRHKRRPVMKAAALAATIKAGTDAVIVGVPEGASIDVFATGYYQTPVWSTAALNGDELAFPMPSPCRYRALIRRWPYQDCAIDIEAVA